MEAKIIIDSFFEESVKVNIEALPPVGGYFFLNDDSKKEMEEKLWKHLEGSKFNNIPEDLKDCVYCQSAKGEDVIKKIDFSISDMIIVDYISFFQQKEGYFEIIISLRTG